MNNGWLLKNKDMVLFRRTYYFGINTLSQGLWRYKVCTESICSFHSVYLLWFIGSSHKKKNGRSFTRRIIEGPFCWNCNQSTQLTATVSLDWHFNAMGLAYVRMVVAVAIRLYFYHWLFIFWLFTAHFEIISE